MWRVAVALAFVIALFAWRPAQPPVVLDEDRLPHVTAAVAPPDSIEELRARIAAVLEREGVPGAGIALVDRDGPIWIGGVGVADRMTNVPVDGNTVFRVASITKLVVGLGVMRLVEQGKLSLDRPLREVIPDVAIANPWEATDPVTLAQALEHTAGFDDWHPNEVFTGDDAMTPADALAINPRSRAVRWRPGTRNAYSNVGYSVAARAIEVATGEPFDRWLRREVLAPLGLPDADFRRTETLATRLATGYVERNRPARFRPIPHRAAGALNASTTDLARIVQFMLRGHGFPAIVSPAGLDRTERSGLPYPPLDIAYGFGNGGDVDHAVRGRGHDGGLPGFLSVLRYFPELGRGYVILLNATHSFAAYHEVRALVFAYLARDRKPGLAAPAVTDPPRAKFYAFASPRHQLFAFIDRTMFGWRPIETPEGLALAPLTGGQLPLVPADRGAYRLPHQSGSSVRFTDNRGTPVMLAGAAYAEAAPWWSARLRYLVVALAMSLLYFAPMWAIGAIAIANFRKRYIAAKGPLLWPALASVCIIALPRLFGEAALEQVLGEVHPLTIAVWLTTLVLPIAAIAGAVSIVRWARHPERPPRRFLIVPATCTVAALGVSMWFAANGIIGLRIWAW